MYSSIFNEVDNILGKLDIEEIKANSFRYHQKRDSTGLMLEILIPGVEKDKVSIEIENNKLSVSAKTDKKSYFSKDFVCSWVITPDLDQDAMTANLSNGILKISMPNKVKENNKKVIPILN